MLRILDISRSALMAQRERMNVIAGNIANANTTRDADGNLKPFVRRYVEFFASEDHQGPEGQVGYRVKKQTGLMPYTEHKPNHPDANAQGYVDKPAIDVMNEMTDMLLASRAYEANVTAIQMSRQMAEQTLRLLQ